MSAQICESGQFSVQIFYCLDIIGISRNPKDWHGQRTLAREQTIRLIGARNSVFMDVSLCYFRDFWLDVTNSYDSIPESSRLIVISCRKGRELTAVWLIYQERRRYDCRRILWVLLSLSEDLVLFRILTFCCPPSGRVIFFCGSDCRGHQIQPKILCLRQIPTKFKGNSRKNTDFSSVHQIWILRIPRKKSLCPQ